MEGLNMSTGMSCSAENAAVDCSYTVAAAAMDAGASKPRITSRHRGLYFDSKHNAWRVRIFYLGRQRHIGRYKDETMAAQAYDRAAYFLYGTRANLNFSLRDVLADQGDVPASIRQAKEQPTARMHAVKHMGSVSGASSSSSSTCSYSPHYNQSVYPHNNVSPAAAAAGASVGQFAAAAPAGYIAMQQPQQQQLMVPQQFFMAPAGAAPEQQIVLLGPQHQQYQQQQYVMAGGVPQNLQQPAAVVHHHHHLAAVSAGAVQMHSSNPQQLQAGMLLPPGMQQQQPNGFMPDVVASVIAALDLPPQSLPQAAALAAASGSAASNSMVMMHPALSMPQSGVGNVVLQTPSAAAAAGSVSHALSGMVPQLGPNVSMPGALAASGAPCSAASEAGALALHGPALLGDLPTAAHSTAAIGALQQQQGLVAGSGNATAPYMLDQQHLDMRSQQADAMGWQQQQQQVMMMGHHHQQMQALQMQQQQQYPTEMHSQQHPAMQACMPSVSVAGPAQHGTAAAGMPACPLLQPAHASPSMAQQQQQCSVPAFYAGAAPTNMQW